MSRLEAPSEPSMEEILAQIRKIIADEPLQARAEHAHIAAQRRSQAPRPPQLTPAARPEQPRESTVPALDAIARLESVLNSTSTPLADDDLSDLVEPPAPELAAAASEPPIALEAIEPPAPPSAPQAQEIEMAAEAPAAVAIEPSPAAPLVEPTAQVEAVLPPAITFAPPQEAEPVADAMETALDTLAAGLAAVAVKPAQELSAPAVAEPDPSPHEEQPVAVETASVEPVGETPSPVSEEMSQVQIAAAAGEIATTALDTSAEPLPEIIDQSASDLTAPAPTSAMAPMEAEHTPVAAHDQPSEPVADVPHAVAAAVQADMPVAANPKPDPVFAIAPTQPVEAVVAPPEPAAIGPASTTAQAAQPDAPPAAATDDAATNLDDTMADLLRPMLRQWLDENMPRIVERALRVEMAQMRKPKK